MWGTISNGLWNGMVGMLNEKTVDIAVADLSITNARSRVIDYLPSLVQYTEGLYMKNPGDAFSYDLYLQPFTKTSWVWRNAHLLLLGGCLHVSSSIQKD